MSGNVYEWTRSGFESYPYKAEAGRESLEVSAQPLRVLRGGAFYYSTRYVRRANRYWSSPVSRYDLMGFRVVLSPFRS